MNSLSNQEKDFIKQLWCEGVSIPEIAERAEVAIGTVYRITADLRGAIPRTKGYSILTRAKRNGLGVQSERRRENAAFGRKVLAKS